MEQLIILIFILFIAIIIFEFVCMYLTYKKAGAPGWAVFVPLYNYIALFKLVNVPMWMILLLFFPVVNLYPLYLVYTSLAERLGKSKAYGIGLLLLPIFTYPILAFSKVEVESRYVNSLEEANSSSTSLMTGPIEPLGALPDAGEIVPPIVEEPNYNDMNYTEFTPINGISYNMMEPELQPLDPVVPVNIENPLTAQQKVQHIEEEKEVYPDVNVFRTCPNCGTKLEPNVQVCFLCGKRLDD